jgi:hypothetical protein
MKLRPLSLTSVIYETQASYTFNICPHLLCMKLRPRSHRMFLEYMDTEACIRPFMCACQAALQAETDARATPNSTPESGTNSSTPDNGTKISRPDNGTNSSRPESGTNSAQPPGSPGGTAMPSWIWKGSASIVAVSS